MEFIRETDPPAKFSVPDRPTVYQQLEFFSTFNGTMSESVRFVRMWNASKPLIDEWECKAFPDLLTVDLAEVDDSTITALVLWASVRVMRHINSLVATDPN